MKGVIQRVNYASVTVDDVVVGKIGVGLAVLVGFGKDDTEKNLKLMAEKIVNMRIFSNSEDRFDYSLLDIKGEILLIPQFTLFADTSHGRRPEFFSALEPSKASPLFDKFVDIVKSLGVSKTECGIFGATMKVALENDGPVTISLDI
ncbi:MAG: D-aminoacyl-tRNA deacylase [Bdellovibrionota bacterium]|jgi:D-tyrosyl-tRNA(Tyr) deacylase